MHTVLPSPLCPVWGTLSQERSRSPWFRLSAPSTWQKGSISKAVWSSLCQNRMASERMQGPKKIRQMAAAPGFESQGQSCSAAPFPAPPTNGHSCQHSGLWCGTGYLQALLDPITNPYLGPPSWLHPVTVLVSELGRSWWAASLIL